MILINNYDAIKFVNNELIPIPMAAISRERLIELKYAQLTVAPQSAADARGGIF